MNVPGAALITSGLIFVCGLFCVLSQRNMLRIIAAAEMIIVSAAVNVAAFTHYLYRGCSGGYVFAVFAFMFAALELAVGLGLIVFLHKKKKIVLEDKLNALKG